MGLSNDFLSDLVSLKNSGNLNGASSVVEIGAQQLSNAFLRDEANIEAILLIQLQAFVAWNSY